MQNRSVARTLAVVVAAWLAVAVPFVFFDHAGTVPEVTHVTGWLVAGGLLGAAITLARRPLHALGGAALLGFATLLGVLLDGPMAPQPLAMLATWPQTWLIVGALAARGVALAVQQRRHGSAALRTYLAASR